MEGSRTVDWLQQKEEGMIEDPLGAFGQRGGDYSVIKALPIPRPPEYT